MTMEFSQCRRATLAILGLLLGSAVAAAAAQPKEALPAALKRARVRPEQVGFVFLDASGKPLLGHNTETLYIVASNNKIITTAAALALLGPEFQWSTTLYTQGTVVNGTLQGDLWVHGTGDPNISGRSYEGDTLHLFRTWAGALKARGIHAVDGGLHLDDSAFDGPAIHPSWPERYWSSWFGAETSALSLSDNCVSVQITAPPVAKREVALSLYPATSYVSLINHCFTAKRPRGPWGIRRHPEDNTIYVSGVVRSGRSPDPVWIPVHDPTGFFGTVMKETLAREGVEVRGPVARGRLPRGPLALVDRFTSDLAESVVITNKRSQNFYAEQILKTIGHRFHGTGSFETGIERVSSFLERCVGIPHDAYDQVDGSGLSRENRFTPAQIASVLHHMAQTPEGAPLRDSLPIGGIDGTLENRLQDPALRLRVRAKTGYLAGVSGLSGYLEGRSGDTYAFSILVNAEEVSKASMDRLEEAIVKEALARLP